MAIEVTTATAPEYWASYFVNGDSSGLEPDEKIRADHWLSIQAQEGWYVVDVERDSEGEAIESRFTRHYDLYDTLSDCTGGQVIDYVLHRTV